MSLSSTIKDAALSLGFDVVGIADLPRDSPSHHIVSTGLPGHLYRRLTAWLAAGYHATMAWMARTPGRRADPRLVLPGCRSVIMVGMNYDSSLRADESPGKGRIARYAWGRDYHLVLGERLAALCRRLETLAPGERHRWYVDTGPVMEKAWAQQAGLGWIGKHSNLVSPQHGSWLLLGTVLTTLELASDVPGQDLCGTCTLCIKACPTGAIVEPYVVDARRCLSYLTIEHRGADIPSDFSQRMGNHIFGCDDCLDVCPYNTQALATTQAGFAPLGWTLNASLNAILAWTESEFLAQTRDSPVRRAKYEGFLRNVRLALRNAAPKTDGVPRGPDQAGGV